VRKNPMLNNSVKPLKRSFLKKDITTRKSIIAKHSMDKLKSVLQNYFKYKKLPIESFQHSSKSNVLISQISHKETKKEYLDSKNFKLEISNVSPNVKNATIRLGYSNMTASGIEIKTTSIYDLKEIKRLKYADKARYLLADERYDVFNLWGNSEFGAIIKKMKIDFYNNGKIKVIITNGEFEFPDDLTDKKIKADPINNINYFKKHNIKFKLNKVEIALN
jgi:hypothetical protein